MKVEISRNGVKRILLIPEDELDKMFLKQFSTENVTVELIDKPTPSMHGPVSDGLMIQTKKKDE